MPRRGAWLRGVVSAPGGLPSATTRVAAVIGDPVHHSLSPLLLNTAFAQLGLDWVYTAFAVPEGSAGAAIAAMRVLSLGGLNVTMPHKQAVVAHLDDVSEVAARLDAVNCIAWDGARLVGHSTDGAGLLDTLRVDEGFEPEGKRCAVIGAGGAARAAVAALGDAGAAEVIVVNRTADRAASASLLAGGRGRVGTDEEVAGCDLVVNATPMGMAGERAGLLPVSTDHLGHGQVIFDMVYDPPETRFVKAARASGARAVGGIGMLVHQAAYAFGLWTGEAAPTAEMTRVASAAVRTRGQSDLSPSPTV